MNELAVYLLFAVHPSIAVEIAVQVARHVPEVVEHPLLWDLVDAVEKLAVVRYLFAIEPVIGDVGPLSVVHDEDLAGFLLYIGAPAERRPAAVSPARVTSTVGDAILSWVSGT